MRIKFLAAFVGTLLLSTSSLSLASDDNPVLVTAGSDTLTQQQFTTMMDNMPPQMRMILKSQPQLRHGILQKWGEFSILAQEAAATGLKNEPAVQQKIKDITNRILVEEYIRKHTGKTKVTDAMVKKYYNDNKEQFSHGEEIRAQHILVAVDKNASAETQATAKEKILSIQQQLKDGKDFAALAKEYSDDPGSKGTGGDLGFFGHGAMVKSFEDAAFATAIGQVSAPVHSDYGWHLIKVNARKEAGTTALADVKNKIETTIKQQKQKQEVEEILNRLKKKYPIKIQE